MSYEGILALLIALFSFIQFLITRHDNKKENPLSKAVRSLLRDKLMYLCEKYIERGYVTFNELDMLTDMFDCYEGLNGNGFIKELFETVQDLPRKKK